MTTGATREEEALAAIQSKLRGGDIRLHPVTCSIRGKRMMDQAERSGKKQQAQRRVPLRESALRQSKQKYILAAANGRHSNQATTTRPSAQMAIDSYDNNSHSSVTHHSRSRRIISNKNDAEDQVQVKGERGSKRRIEGVCCCFAAGERTASVCSCNCTCRGRRRKTTRLIEELSADEDSGKCHPETEEIIKPSPGAISSAVAAAESVTSTSDEPLIMRQQASDIITATTTDTTTKYPLVAARDEVQKKREQTRSDRQPQANSRQREEQLNRKRRVQTLEQAAESAAASTMINSATRTTTNTSTTNTKTNELTTTNTKCIDRRDLAEKGGPTLIRRRILEQKVKFFRGEEDSDVLFAADGINSSNQLAIARDLSREKNKTLASDKPKGSYHCNRKKPETLLVKSLSALRRKKNSVTMWPSWRQLLTIVLVAIAATSLLASLNLIGQPITSCRLFSACHALQVAQPSAPVQKQDEQRQDQSSSTNTQETSGKDKLQASTPNSSLRQANQQEAEVAAATGNASNVWHATSSSSSFGDSPKQLQVVALQLHLNGPLMAAASSPAAVTMAPATATLSAPSTSGASPSTSQPKMNKLPQVASAASNESPQQAPRGDEQQQQPQVADSKMGLSAASQRHSSKEGKLTGSRTLAEISEELSSGSIGPETAQQRSSEDESMEDDASTGSHSAVLDSAGGSSANNGSSSSSTAPARPLAPSAPISGSRQLDNDQQKQPRGRLNNQQSDNRQSSQLSSSSNRSNPLPVPIVQHNDHQYQQQQPQQQQQSSNQAIKIVAAPALSTGSGGSRKKPEQRSNSQLHHGSEDVTNHKIVEHGDATTRMGQQKPTVSWSLKLPDWDQQQPQQTMEQQASYAGRNNSSMDADSSQNSMDTSANMQQNYGSRAGALNGAASSASYLSTAVSQVTDSLQVDPRIQQIAAMTGSGQQAAAFEESARMSPPTPMLLMAAGSQLPQIRPKPAGQLLVPTGSQLVGLAIPPAAQELLRSLNLHLNELVRTGSGSSSGHPLASETYFGSASAVRPLIVRPLASAFASALHQQQHSQLVAGLPTTTIGLPFLVPNQSLNPTSGSSTQSTSPSKSTGKSFLKRPGSRQQQGSNGSSGSGSRGLFSAASASAPSISLPPLTHLLSPRNPFRLFSSSSAPIGSRFRPSFLQTAASSVSSSKQQATGSSSNSDSNSNGNGNGDRYGNYRPQQTGYPRQLVPPFQGMAMDPQEPVTSLYAHSHSAEQLEKLIRAASQATGVHSPTILPAIVQAPTGAFPGFYIPAIESESESQVNEMRHGEMAAGSGGLTISQIPGTDYILHPDEVRAMMSIGDAAWRKQQLNSAAGEVSSPSNQQQVSSYNQQQYPQQQTFGSYVSAGSYAAPSTTSHQLMQENHSQNLRDFAYVDPGKTMRRDVRHKQQQQQQQLPEALNATHLEGRLASHFRQNNVNAFPAIIRLNDQDYVHWPLVRLSSAMTSGQQQHQQQQQQHAEQSSGSAPQATIHGTSGDHWHSDASNVSPFRALYHMASASEMRSQQAPAYGAAFEAAARQPPTASGLGLDQGEAFHQHPSSRHLFSSVPFQSSRLPLVSVGDHQQQHQPATTRPAAVVSANQDNTGSSDSNSNSETLNKQETRHSSSQMNSSPAPQLSSPKQSTGNQQQVTQTPQQQTTESGFRPNNGPGHAPSWTYDRHQRLQMAPSNTADSSGKLAASGSGSQVPIAGHEQQVNYAPELENSPVRLATQLTPHEIRQVEDSIIETLIVAQTLEHQRKMMHQLAASLEHPVYAAHQQLASGYQAQGAAGTKGLGLGGRRANSRFKASRLFGRRRRRQSKAAKSRAEQQLKQLQVSTSASAPAHQFLLPRLNVSQLAAGLAVSGAPSPINRNNLMHPQLPVLLADQATNKPFQSWSSSSQRSAPQLESRSMMVAEPTEPRPSTLLAPRKQLTSDESQANGFGSRVSKTTNQQKKQPTLRQEAESELEPERDSRRLPEARGGGLAVSSSKPNPTLHRQRGGQLDEMIDFNDDNADPDINVPASNSRRPEVRGDKNQRFNVLDWPAMASDADYFPRGGRESGVRDGADRRRHNQAPERPKQRASGLEAARSAAAPRPSQSRLQSYVMPKFKLQFAQDYTAREGVPIYNNNVRVGGVLDRPRSVAATAQIASQADPFAGPREAAPEPEFSRSENADSEETAVDEPDEAEESAPVGQTVRPHAPLRHQGTV